MKLAQIFLMEKGHNKYTLWINKATNINISDGTQRKIKRKLHLNILLGKCISVSLFILDKWISLNSLMKVFCMNISRASSFTIKTLPS